MHTRVINAGRDEVYLHYNSDLSGDVIVAREAGDLARIPGAELVDLVRLCTHDEEDDDMTPRYDPDHALPDRPWWARHYGTRADVCEYVRIDGRVTKTGLHASAATVRTFLGLLDAEHPLDAKHEELKRAILDRQEDEMDRTTQHPLAAATDAEIRAELARREEERAAEVRRLWRRTADGLPPDGTLAVVAWGPLESPEVVVLALEKGAWVSPEDEDEGASWPVYGFGSPKHWMPLVRPEEGA